MQTVRLCLIDHAASLGSVRHTMSRRLRVATDLGRFQLPGQQAMSKLILTLQLAAAWGPAALWRAWIGCHPTSAHATVTPGNSRKNPWRMLQNDGDIRDLGLVVELHACIQQEQWWVMKTCQPSWYLFHPISQVLHELNDEDTWVCACQQQCSHYHYHHFFFFFFSPLFLFLFLFVFLLLSLLLVRVVVLVVWLLGLFPGTLATHPKGNPCASMVLEMTHTHRAAFGCRMLTPLGA